MILEVLGQRGQPGVDTISVIHQFNLPQEFPEATLADARQGRRPAFIAAARPEAAEPALNAVVQSLQSRCLPVQTGRFREHMDVDAVNDGPICILLDSRRTF